MLFGDNNNASNMYIYLSDNIFTCIKKYLAHFENIKLILLLIHFELKAKCFL